MNWDCLIIAAAVAASLAYLVRLRSRRKGSRNACGSSACGCCPQASVKHHGIPYDD